VQYRKQSKVIYTTEEKRQLDAILKAFESYIDGQDHFDIVYSKKIGYVWLLAEDPEAEAVRQLNTPEAMLAVLFQGIIDEVNDSRLCYQNNHIPIKI